MNDLNNNNTTFNLPSYINIPFFLYQDNRLERSALLIAAFFYSIHTAGQSIKASKDYLCQLAGIGKSQYFCILNQLEDIGYIQRTGFTNRKKTLWVYSPKSELIVDDMNTSPPSRTSVKVLNTSPVHRTKLVRSTGLNLSGRPDTDIKEDIKDNKKLTTENLTPSSSDFFTPKQQTQLLDSKLDSDDRPDDKFLKHCQHHIESQKNDLTKFQRLAGLKKILLGLEETGEFFKSRNFFDAEEEKKKQADSDRKQKMHEDAQEKMHREKINPVKQPEQRKGSPTKLADMLKGFQHANKGTMPETTVSNRA